MDTGLSVKCWVGFKRTGGGVAEEAPMLDASVAGVEPPAFVDDP